MTVDELRALVVERRAQEQAATPGEWTVGREHVEEVWGAGSNMPILTADNGRRWYGMSKDNYDLIASLRNLEPARLDAAEELLQLAEDFRDSTRYGTLLSIAARMLGAGE